MISVPLWCARGQYDRIWTVRCSLFDPRYSLEGTLASRVGEASKFGNIIVRLLAKVVHACFNEYALYIMRLMTCKVHLKEQIAVVCK